MANFSALKTAIQNAIKQNGNEEITGDVLQQILLSIVSTMGDGAINTIEQNLSSETLARQGADNTLQSNIDAEALARGNADTQLQNAINAIKANIDNGYVYAGIATTSSTPVSGKVFYIATAAGTYTNFGGQVLTQGINILRFNGSVWSSQQLIGIDDVPTAGSNNLVKSGGVQNELALGAVYDVSAKNPTGGPNNDGKWESLSALLLDANLNTLIPTAYRKGGMSIKFVHTNDNKYVQYRLMADTFSTTESDWQGVDDEPTAGSDNLVKSGGVAEAIDDIKTKEKKSITAEKLISYYYIDTTGHRQDYSQFGIFGGLAIKKGDVCTCIVSNINAAVSPLAFSTNNSYYSDMLCEQVVQFVEGQTVYEATAEFDGYVFLTSDNNSSPLLEIVTSFDFEQMSEDIELLKAEDVIQNNQIAAINDKLDLQVPVNVPIGKQGFYVNTNGERGEYYIWAIYGAIPVNRNDIIKVSNLQGINAAACPIAWADNPNMDSDMSSTPLAVYQDGVTEYNVTIQNDGYIFISADINVKPNVFKTKDISDVVTYKLLDKKIAWFGDSITEGYGRVPYDEKYGWAAPIERDFGAVCDNQGISSATLRDQTSIGRHCIPLDLVNYINNGGDADYFILSGGFNDRDNSLQWGTVDKNSYSEYADLGYSTTTEALEKMIAYCMLNLSPKKFGFIVCYDINDAPENPGWEPAHWNELADRLIEACVKWGMPYLDLRKTCGFNLCTNGLREIYGTDLKAITNTYDATIGYVADQRVVYNGAVYKANQQIPAPAGVFDSTKWTQISDDNGYDRSHCNRFAYDKMTNLVADWILSL